VGLEGCALVGQAGQGGRAGQVEQLARSALVLAQARQALEQELALVVLLSLGRIHDATLGIDLLARTCKAVDQTSSLCGNKHVPARTKSKDPPCLHTCSNSPCHGSRLGLTRGLLVLVWDGVLVLVLAVLMEQELEQQLEQKLALVAPLGLRRIHDATSGIDLLARICKAVDQTSSLCGNKHVLARTMSKDHPCLHIRSNSLCHGSRLGLTQGLLVLVWDGVLVLVWVVVLLVVLVMVVVVVVLLPGSNRC